jgi:hypothetical protein
MRAKENSMRWIVRDLARQPGLLRQSRKGRKSEGFAGGFQSFTEQQITRSVVGDRQRIAIFLLPSRNSSL